MILWPGVGKKHWKTLWSVRAPPYELSFELCVRLSRRERHSQRQKTSRGRYWLLHLLLTLSIHAARYAQIQHIPIEHFWFTASWSLLLAQSEPEVTLCCSQKNLFRDRQHFVNICEKVCTQKWCILIYGSLQACFDQPLILTQLLIQCNLHWRSPVTSKWAPEGLKAVEHKLHRQKYVMSRQNVLTVKIILKSNSSWTKVLYKTNRQKTVQDNTLQVNRFKPF